MHYRIFEVEGQQRFSYISKDNRTSNILILNRISNCSSKNEKVSSIVPNQYKEAGR